MFFAALFWVYGDYKPQNRKSNSKQKTSPQSYKTQIDILPFPGLAQTGTEQLGQGATLLGWPKSIYLTNILPLFTEIEKNNCFSIYTGSDLNNIFRRKPLKIDSETLPKREFTPAILFLFGLRIIHSVGGE